MPQELLKVLLIEHDPGFARYVGEMIGQARDLSAEIRSAASLMAGLSELQAHTFDAVLLDLCVPDGAGLANILLIKAQAPQLPIIAAGDADDEIVASRSCMRARRITWSRASSPPPGWSAPSAMPSSGTEWT